MKTGGLDDEYCHSSPGDGYRKRPQLRPQLFLVRKDSSRGLEDAGMGACGRLEYAAFATSSSKGCAASLRELISQVSPADAAN